MELPADEPCHVTHGWYIENASTQSKEYIKIFLTNKVIFLLGVDINLTRTDLVYHYNSTEDRLGKAFYIQYPENHFIGEHQFTGVWINLGTQTIYGRTITVNFISSKEVTPKQRDDNGLF